MRTVIFDLDGTLADTSGDLIAAANACFVGLGHGRLLDPKADAATALRGGRAMLTLGFSRLEGTLDVDTLEAAITAQYSVLLRHYDDRISEHTTLYPGAIAAIDMLAGKGFAIGICTNKPAALAEKLMRALGVRDRFGALVGADTLPVRKPDPAPFFAAVQQAGGSASRALLVGDTLTDHTTARAAGVPSVLVTFGPGGEDLRDLGPDAFLDNYADLPDLAERLLR
jgi:phosphoglycolate phosphatase